VKQCMSRYFALVAPLVVLASCAYAPGDASNPLARKITWFSFVAGDDIRAACGPGAPDRFRLVYNGVWAEQVRIYEVGFGGPRQLDQRVIGSGNLSELSVSHLLAPWAGKTASLTLDTDEYASLIRKLEAGGAFHTPGVTMTLAANDFYWIAASCHDGGFHLNAWLYPSDGFAHAAFATWLTALDTTGVPINPPRPWTEVGSHNSGGTNSSYSDSGVPARGARPDSNWAFGISQDRLVDQIKF